MRVFLDRSARFYKADDRRNAGDSEVPFPSLAMLNLLPDDGSAKSLEEVQVAVHNCAVAGLDPSRPIVRNADGVLANV